MDTKTNTAEDVIRDFMVSLRTFNNSLMELHKAESDVAVMDEFNNLAGEQISEMSEMVDVYLKMHIDGSRANLESARKRVQREAREFLNLYMDVQKYHIPVNPELISKAKKFAR